MKIKNDPVWDTLMDGIEMLILQTIVGDTLISDTKVLLEWV